MSYKFTVFYADGTKTFSEEYPTIAECYDALPFDWKYLSDVIGSDREADIKFLEEFFKEEFFETGNSACVYDARTPDVLLGIDGNVTEISIFESH